MEVKLKFIKFQGHEGEIEKTRSLVQENLRKKTFEDFTRLREAFEYEDLDHSGRLTLVAVYRVCQAFKIPISAARLAILLDHCTDRKKDQTDYAKFVELINWRDHPRNGQKCVLNRVGFGTQIFRDHESRIFPSFVLIGIWKSRGLGLRLENLVYQNPQVPKIGILFSECEAGRLFIPRIRIFDPGDSSDRDFFRWIWYPDKKPNLILNTQTGNFSFENN